MPKNPPALLLLAAAALWPAALISVHAEAPAAPAATAPASQPAAMPHLRVDRERRCVDLDAAVVLREADWLELLACSPRSREHESILVVPARPSHVHLALLTLGVEPGAPMTWKREGEEVKFVEPRGPRVAITLIYEKDGKTVEVPANEWVFNQKTKEVLKGNTWLFTGSEFSEFDGQKVYRADLNGTVISLVDFGDDLLSRQTKMTDKDDQSTWGVNTKVVPPIGTKVIIRLTPLAEAPTTQPAGK
jgi:hypothetical protein